MRARRGAIPRWSGRRVPGPRNGRGRNEWPEAAASSGSSLPPRGTRSSAGEPCWSSAVHGVRTGRALGQRVGREKRWRPRPGRGAPRGRYGPTPRRREPPSPRRLGGGGGAAGGRGRTRAGTANARRPRAAPPRPAARPPGRARVPGSDAAGDARSGRSGQPGGAEPKLEAQDALYVALELALAALSVAGNVLVCAAVGASSALQTPTNYFLVSLAAADMAVGLFAIPFAVTISLGFCTDLHSCLFLACFVLVLTQSSIFSLLAVAVDRYLAVRVPLRYKSLVTGARARAVIAVLWVLAFGIGLTPFLGWNRGKGSATNCTEPGDRPANDSCCRVKCLFENVVPMSYMVYFNFFGCVLPPLLTMLAIYVKIFMVACRQLQRMELRDHSRTVLQREIHVAKSLAMIVGIFALCWLPVHAINCATLFQPAWAKEKPRWVMNTAILLSHANSVVNPIVYAYRNRDFRCMFHRIISRYVLCQTDVLKSGNGPAGPQPALDVSL
ncbi:adenosine receptor A2b [Camelus ferus]|uniref:Adenosine receptor A2 n=1 Tax=Camelus ferus TaxID=419612 RepID=A0A8B8UHV3_CAMFR|nr:adenosine receptor A2b [Camelus ferus]